MEAIIEDCRNHIPAQHKYRPYFHPELNHGLDLLQSDEALDCYIGAYGEMHHSKCKAVLQNLPFPPEEKIEGGLSVEIVDWGCGQGIGAVSIIDFLKERDLTQWLKKVTLIEPSEAAISRAVVNVTKATAQRVRVVPIMLTFLQMVMILKSRVFILNNSLSFIYFQIFLTLRVLI